jgi:hypothetical protein
MAGMTAADREIAQELRQRLAQERRAYEDEI